MWLFIMSVLICLEYIKIIFLIGAFEKEEMDEEVRDWILVLFWR